MTVAISDRSWMVKKEILCCRVRINNRAIKRSDSGMFRVAKTCAAGFDYFQEGENIAVDIGDVPA